MKADYNPYIKSICNFSEESPISLCFNSRISPLIKISGNNITYYNTKNEKANAILKRAATDKFIIVWCGQYSSDVFDVTAKEINEIEILYS
jgi:hypothetical protein